jgi:predicted transcriptional regulator
MIKTIIMDLQAEIKWIETALSESNDPTFIKAVKNMIQSMRKVKQSMSTERISVEQYNRELDESIAQIERGEFYTQEEVEKMAEEW